MKLTAKTEIDAPIGFVFLRLVDEQLWQARAAQVGIDVQPGDGKAQSPPTSWQLRFLVRGAMVDLDLMIKDRRPNERLVLRFSNRQAEGTIILALGAVTPQRTRLEIAIDGRPRTIAARLLLQTLKLRKRWIQKQLHERMGRVADVIEKRYAEDKVV